MKTQLSVYIHDVLSKNGILQKLIMKLSLPMLPVEIRMVGNESYSRNDRLFTIFCPSACVV